MSIIGANQALSRMGLTNHDQEDFANIQQAAARRVEHKFCTSLRCTRDPNGLRRIYKETESSQCPDCSHALRSKWVRMSV